MLDLSSLTKAPVRLKKNRVWRPFIGGKLLDEWQGIQDPRDAHYPEEWIASVVKSNNPKGGADEGLSYLDIPRHENVALHEVIAKYPLPMLGASHVREYGHSPAILFKAIDSYSRLLIQVHPNKEYALKYFNSRFGKAEAWFIIATRNINAEEPYVLLGFKPGITKEHWVDLFNKQDIPGMVSCLNKIKAHQGDIFFIEGGVPHAMGPGVLFTEIMEPTDYTIRTERYAPDGLKLTDEQLHLGLGFAAMFDCFVYQGCNPAEASKRWKRKGKIIKEGPDGTMVKLLDDKDDKYFSINTIGTKGAIDLAKTGTFSIILVLAGRGKLIWEQGEIELNQADELFLPACLGNISINTSRMIKLNQVYPPTLIGA